jgi:peptide/nickel transport system ATP-binding protein
MADLLLDIQGLSLRFPTFGGLVTALDDVSLVIPRGRAMGLVGESGSGKSSLLLAMLGLLGKDAQVSATHAKFDGQEFLGMAQALRGKRIATVFQDPSAALNPALRIGVQVAEPLTLHRGMNWRDALKRAEELLAETGIHHPTAVARSYPHQLSGGMKQRAVIAQALACEPELLLLDEPTTALDVTVEAQILDLLESLRAKRGISLLLVSHNLGIVDRICDDLTVLYAGRVVEQGACADVLALPRHPYTKGLMAAMPVIGRTVDRLTSIEGGLPDVSQPIPGCNFMPRCPFAVASCALPQVLAGVDGHLVRCHRAVETARLAWPLAPVADAIPVDDKLLVPLIAAQGLTRSFPLERGWFSGLSWQGGMPRWQKAVTIPAVNGVDIEVGTGEVLGLVGESGSGKSTIGRLLLRLLAADAGELHFKGVRIPARPPLAFSRDAQIVFQNPDSSLNPHHTIGEILARPLVRFGIAGGAALDAEVDRLLDVVRLSRSYRQRYPHQLSGGEKQRIGIARAIAGRPRFIVCDEAVSALDVSVQAAVLNLLADLRREFGLSYLFISHDINVIAHISDRVAVLYRGAVMQQGAKADIMRGPHHPYTAMLLSAVPVVGVARQRGSEALMPVADASTAIDGRGCPFAPRCPRNLGRRCHEDVPQPRALSSGCVIACHLPENELDTAVVGQASREPVAVLS